MQNGLLLQILSKRAQDLAEGRPQTGPRGLFFYNRFRFFITGYKKQVAVYAIYSFIPQAIDAELAFTSNP